ncbi:DUF2490 domain-containing protein [Sediminibacterium ginsengisoli]|nr:DUF2490 domain-containing protein [Sediminibacterium ginsengisoli]
MALLLSLAGQAQVKTDGLGTWNVISGKINFNSKWNAFGEAQLRSQQFFNGFSYYEYKGGIGYNIQKNLTVLVGVGNYHTYTPFGNFTDPELANEVRTWEQLTITNNISRLKLEHRYRIEQRFIGSSFHSRFRYRMNGILPINHKVLQPKTWYAGASAEVFILDKAPHFEQSRLFLGLGYQLNEKLTLQTGFIHRFDQTSSYTTFSKNFIQTTLFFDFGQSKSGRERHPSTED